MRNSFRPGWSCFVTSCLLAALILSNPPLANAQPSLNLNPTSVVPGDTVTVTWSGIPSPAPDDWIGLYAEGTDDSQFIDWFYVSCSQSPGSAQADGSCPFVIPANLTPGMYDMRLFSNNGFTRLATSNALTVTEGGTQLIASPASVPAGGTVTATWSGIPLPTPTDWLGLYVPGAPDTAYLAWRYTTGAPSGNVPFVLPTTLAPGAHELRLFANDGFTRLATSNPFTVTGGTTPGGDLVRFLRQSTFGPTPDLIARVQQIGFEAFLDEQFAAPRSDYPLFDREGREMDLMPFNRDNATCPSPSICLTDNYTLYPLQVHFFYNALHGQDQVRQRVAWALSQILVTSGADANLFRTGRMRHYQQLLYGNALGNYRDILYNVTLHPTMGRYLDMVDNRCQTPTPPDVNICRNGLAVKPNENYAREILQLFSIGLYLLNPDGTLQVDENGNPIFSYNQETIEEFSRVFTGWTFAPQLAAGIVNYRDPMRVFLDGALREARHDKGSKTLLNGFQLPGGQTAEEELNAAIDNILSHQNTAPFISKILIQNLVTSNPSPAYVGRVASVFSANLSSPTQLQAVVKAILLDQEARGDFVDPAAEPVYGKLNEPVLSVTNLLRAFNVASFDRSGPSDGVLAGSPRAGVRNYVGEMDQAPFLSPTVFNFFQYADTEVPGFDGVLGPEFGIQSSVTEIRRANFANTMAFSGIPPLTVDRPVGTSIDLSPWVALAGDPDLLIEELNRLLLHGSMSAQMRQIVRDAVLSVPDSDPLLRARTAIYLVATSSQYQVQR